MAVEMKLEIGGNGGSLRGELRSHHLSHLTAILSDLYASHKVTAVRERSTRQRRYNNAYIGIYFLPQNRIEYIERITTNICPSYIFTLLNIKIEYKKIKCK